MKNSYVLAMTIFIIGTVDFSYALQNAGRPTKSCAGAFDNCYQGCVDTSYDEEAACNATWPSGSSEILDCLDSVIAGMSACVGICVSEMSECYQGS